MLSSMGGTMTARNIEIILGGLVDAVRYRDPARIAGFLAPELVWDGVSPGLRCEGREQAMGLIRNRLAAAPLTVDAVEAVDAGEHVIIGLRGPGFNQTPGDLATVGQVFFVFTFSDGKVVRWRDYRTRAAAVAAAGASVPDWR
jgi:limonene-1,2-epoxide hydrolase